MCDRWQGKNGYDNFVADMGPKPSKAHSVDRKRNELGYSKDNCRWATRREQSANTRRNMLITLEGRTQCQAEWARELGISGTAFMKRVKKGYTGEKLFQKGRRGGYQTREERLESAVRKLLFVIGDRDFEGKAEIYALL